MRLLSWSVRDQCACSDSCAASRWSRIRFAIAAKSVPGPFADAAAPNGIHVIGSEPQSEPAVTSCDVRVTVIVLNWNGRCFLESCLLSLQRQALSAVEVLIVDNGSTDGSVEFVRQRFPEVRVIPLETNLGFAGGNNQGIRQACGHYVALLNNDTEADPRWLEELMKALESHPEVGFCASQMVTAMHTLEDSGRDLTFCPAAQSRPETAGVKSIDDPEGLECPFALVSRGCSGSFATRRLADLTTFARAPKIRAETITSVTVLNWSGERLLDAYL